MKNVVVMNGAKAVSLEDAIKVCESIREWQKSLEMHYGYWGVVVRDAWGDRCDTAAEVAAEIVSWEDLLTDEDVTEDDLREFIEAVEEQIEEVNTTDLSVEFNTDAQILWDEFSDGDITLPESFKNCPEERYDEWHDFLWEHILDYCSDEDYGYKSFQLHKVWHNAVGETGHSWNLDLITDSFFDETGLGQF